MIIYESSSQVWSNFDKDTKVGHTQMGMLPQVTGTFSKRYGTTTTWWSAALKRELCGHGTQVNHVEPHGLLLRHSRGKRLLRLHGSREKDGALKHVAIIACSITLFGLSRRICRIIIYHVCPKCLFPSERQQKKMFGTNSWILLSAAVEQVVENPKQDASRCPQAIPLIGKSPSVKFGAWELEPPLT